VIITARRQGGQLCWSQPRTRTSRRAGPAGPPGDRRQACRKGSQLPAGPPWPPGRGSGRGGPGHGRGCSLGV